MQSDRILVVDDEEAIREIVASMLISANYECRQASSGLEALAILNSGQEFELMLSDLMMNELDGIGLLERTKERFPDLPVVMVTAVHDISVALAAIRNGAYDYLLKPFEREQLLAVVRRALENRRLRLENRAYQSNLESLVAARTEQLRQAMSDLERSYDITLEALGDALDLKDAETEGHSKRVTAFTIAIARAMGLQQDAIRVIARGAFLHDAAEIVHAHQERFDGTGYPRGLKGDEIPLGARIFSIADTLDAITSDRPYRAAQSVQAAQEEIKRWAGRQFDPKIVDVFLRMPESIWRDLRREIDSQIYRFSYSPKLTKGGNA